MSDESKHEAIKKRYDAIKGQEDAAQYLKETDRS
jgi:hypothetical protein